MRSIRPLTPLLAIAIVAAACSGPPDSGDGTSPTPAVASPGPAASQPPSPVLPGAGSAATPTTPGGSMPSGRGRIEGIVRYVGSAPLRVKQLTNDIDVATCGERISLQTVLLGSGGAVRNVFVELRDDDDRLLLPAAPADASAITVTIKRCALEPHVLVVPTGSTLEIQNADGILHHLIVPALRNEPLDARLPRYRKRLLLPPTALARPEILAVACDVHPWEVGWWIVSNNPLRALSGVDGRFVIEGVPAGTWRLTAWHEDLKQVEIQVTVAADQGVVAELEFR